MGNLTEVRGQLEKRLAELNDRVTFVERERAEPMSADSAEQAIEAEDDEVIALQDDVLHLEIAAIVAAIRKIDTGTYGNCTSCREDIELARLAVLPSTSLCIDCARAVTA